MKRLTYLRTHDFMGEPIGEELPPRLLITGPNGSGKTKRLTAVRLGIVGLEGRDGLLPWATGPEPLVSVTAPGIVIERKTKIVDDGTGAASSTKTASAVSPSQGERTKSAIAARIERDLAPNVLALDVAALFGTSAKERRRVMLDAMGGASTFSAADALGGLEELLAENTVWTDPEFQAALAPMKAAASDGLAFLSMVEDAAKAQATQARSDKTNAEGVLRSAPTVPPAGNVEEIREELAKLRDVVAEQKAAGKAIEKRAEAQRLREAEEKRIRDAMPGDVEIEERGTKLSLPAFLDDLGTADDDEDAQAILDRRSAKLKRFDALTFGWEGEAEKTEQEAGKAEKHAQRVYDEAVGFVSALERIFLETAADEACPVCLGTDGTFPDPDSEDDPEGLAEAKAQAESRRSILDAAATQLAEAQEDLGKVRSARRLAKDLIKAEEDAAKGWARLREIAQERREAAEEPAYDPGELAAAEAEVERLEGILEEITKAEGAAAERERMGANVETAEKRRKDAIAVQEAAGPKGLAGERLELLVGGVMRRAAEVFSASYPDRRLVLRLYDERGNPDALLAVERDGRGGAWATISGGEKAVAAAALVVALSELAPDRLSVALIEAGEIDDVALSALCDTLSEEKAPAIANVLVATWRVFESTQFSGFEVRELAGEAVAS